MAITTVIRELVAAGLTLEQAVLAAEKFEANAEAERTAASLKRSPGAERQARYVARLKGEVTKSDVTSDSHSGVTLPPEPPLRDKSTPPNPSLRSVKAPARGEWFADLWAVLPHRSGDGRQPAEQKYCRLIRDAKNPEELRSEIMAGALAYAAASVDTERRFLPATLVWLNQARWRDHHTRPEHPPPRGRPGNGRYTGPTLSEMAGVDTIHDLFQSDSDGPRDHHPFERSADAPDTRVPGFAERVREPDRDDGRGNVVDLQFAGAGWR